MMMVLFVGEMLLMLSGKYTSPWIVVHWPCHRSLLRENNDSIEFFHHVRSMLTHMNHWLSWSFERICNINYYFDGDDDANVDEDNRNLVRIDKLNSTISMNRYRLLTIRMK